MMTSINERTHFFLNIYLSHFIRKGWCFLCVRGELETETDSHILTPSSSDHSSTSFAFWWAAQPWVLRAQALCLELVLTPASSPTGTRTNSSRLWHLVPVEVRIFTEFNHVHRSRWYSDILDRTHLFLPLIYTGASLDWRLGRVPICNKIDIFCVHIFVFIHSSCHIDVMIFGRNWLHKPSIINWFPSTFGLVLSHHLWWGNIVKAM